MSLRTWNQSGSALINAIIAVGIVSAISAFIFSQTQVTDKSSRNPRVKSAMAIAESQVRALASSTLSYNCTGDGAQKNCHFKDEILKELNKSIPGATCAHGVQSCGLQIGFVPGSSQYYNPATGIFSARVSYTGTDVAMKPLDISFQLPDGTFHSGAFTCPTAQPFFAGYDGVGNPICRTVPNSCYEPMNLESPGVYIYSLDPTSLRPHCKALSAVTMAGCPSGGFLDKIAMTTGMLDTACANRPNAFSIFGYTPGAATQVASLAQGGYPVAEPLPPPSGGGSGGGTSGGGSGGGGGSTPSTLPPTSTTTTSTTTSTIHRGGGGGGGGCFIAGTPILMADGTEKPIEQIQVGDQVLGYDEEGKALMAQSVVKLHHHKANDQLLHEFHMADGSVVVPNDIHPIFVVEQNAYFKTSEIKQMLDAGVKISFQRADGARIRVKDLVLKKAFTAVYNFEVEGLKSISNEYGAFGDGHNYYANGFLVHNAIYGNGLGKVVQIYILGVPSFGLVPIKGAE